MSSIIVPRDYPGFTSFKTVGPIRYPFRWQRDALVQATLEPTVTQLAPAPAQFDRPPVPIEFAFTATIAATKLLVVIAESEVSASVGLDQQLPVLRLTRRSLAAEPLASTTKAIWAHKRFQHDPVDRLRLTEEIADLPRGRPFADIVTLLRNPFVEPARQVFSMLANGYLVADLSNGITPATLLRLGPAATAEPPPRPIERLRTP